LPPIVARALADPPPARMPWYRAIAPAYLNLFIWAPFFDQLWVGREARSGTTWLVADALLGALFCFGLFLSAASWGLRFRLPLVVVASSTFGATGSEWICGVAVSIAGVVWYAIAINYAVDSTLLGLRACGLIQASGVAPWHAGPILLKSPVFLGTTLFWIWTTRKAIMMRLSGVVVALMKVYAPIALLLLTATAFWGLLPPWSSGLASKGGPDLASAPIQIHGGERAIPVIVGYFALGALFSVDWGAMVNARRDILRAGLLCVLGASAWTSIMSLVVVSNTASVVGADAMFRQTPLDPVPLSFRWAVFQGREIYPAYASWAILLLFGLAALAPAVSALARYTEVVSTHWESLRPGRATWIACPIAFMLIATAQVDRLGLYYRAMGIVFAPVLGAMAGDRLKTHEGRIAVRTGINPAGLIAWASGFAAGTLLELTSGIQPGVIASLQPGSICGFIVSACGYRLLCRFGLESTAAFPGGSGKDSVHGIGGAGE
jgi:cytosine permease